MDLSKQTGVPDTTNEANLEQAKEVIRSAIKNNQQCFMGEILKENKDRHSQTEISKALNQMIAGREIRQKEDIYEHDWEYILV